MSSHEPASEVLRREGAVAAEDVVRWLAEACDALETLRAGGVESTVSLDTLRVSRAPGVGALVDASPLPPGTTDAPRAQVRALAAAGFELLKGLPPPELPNDDAWVGLRPELKALLAPALEGTGAAEPAAFARQLRGLGRAETAGYEAPPVADTQLSTKLQASTDASRTGQLFGAWELLELLGSGGMGDVYRARHARLGREAAVKVLRPELAALPEVVQRLFQEARVVNEINHPHIVQIFDFVEEPQRVYCVMELLHGRSLAQLAAEDGPLPLKRIARLVGQACAALQAAHERGVVHRDVKPDNLFVTVGPDGRDVLKVLDFGIARRLTGEGARTQHGQVLGTPYYMAPEQAAGRAVDVRADVYALGVALFELVSGRDFSRVERPEPLTQSATGEAVPPELTRLIAQCLELDPDKRPATAAAVGDVLRKVADLPAPPRPSTQALEAAAGLGPRRTPRVALVGVGAVVAIAAGLWWTTSQVSPPEPTPSEPAGATDAGMAEVGAPEPAVDAGGPGAVVTSGPEVDAGTSTARPVRPVVKATKKPPPPPAVDPLASRVEAARRRHARLLEKHGATQLTSIERAAIGALLDEARRDPPQVQLSTLQSAEAALDDAERRLDR
ncbi:MAG: serine/threonine-protein kinase [Myxococcota bacterium]